MVWQSVKNTVIAESVSLWFRNTFNHVLSYCHAYMHHWPHPFYNTFSDLDLGWGSQSQWKAVPFDVIFSHTFQLIKMKLDVVLKQFKMNFLCLLLYDIFVIKGSDCTENTQPANQLLPCTPSPTPHPPPLPKRPTFEHLWTTESYIFNLGPSGLDLDSKSKG